MALFLARKVLILLVGLGLLSVSVQAYSTLEPKKLYVGANSTTPTSVALIVTNNRVGIGLTAPTSKLSVSTTGTEFTGSVFSSVFRTNSGTLGSTAGSELALGSIGYLTGNNCALGIRAIRTRAGSDWYSTAIGLSMDVDNTVRAGPYLYLTSSGNVGIGTTVPTHKLEVNGSMKCSGWNITDVMNNQTTASSGASGVVLSTNTFTKAESGSTLIIFASGSGLKAAGALLAVTVSIADTSGSVVYTLGTLYSYTNITGSHQVLIPRQFVKTGVAAGTYRIKFVSDATTFLYTNYDFFSCTVTELPL